MKKNIAFQKTPANDGLPTGWYKRDGLPIWYCKDFDVLFEITNAHESAPGVWFISLAGMKFKQMDLLPAAREYKLPEDTVEIFIVAFGHIREYFGFMMSSASFNIENLQKFKDEQEQ